MNLGRKVSNKLKNYDIVKNSKKFFIASGILILVGIIIISIWGFNTGIDFTGGTVLNVKVGSELEEGNNYETYVDDIEDILNDNGVELSLAQQEGEGASASILIRYQDVDGTSTSEMEAITEAIKTDIAAYNVSFEVEESQRIGASATSALLVDAMLAIVIATILILIYIAIRFELLNGLTAIVALLHDVLIMCSLVAIFRIQINSAFIAALITIIGYSINDTIVVFDRVRENRAKDEYKNHSNAKVVNISIRETIVRTINTSLTTLFTITVLAIITVPTIREFSIPIIFGLLAGTYSSIFIATPIWALVNDNTKPRKEASKKKTVKKTTEETV